MNKNYLLHNETAKKLYFNYAQNLPIITMTSQPEPSDKIYSNLSEAFLLNDPYKLFAMRHCGIDEKLITGDTSDYEKFKAFCSVLPKFAGNPLYLLSHIELNKHFGCEHSICEENCDLIWQEVNRKIQHNFITEKSILTDNNIENRYTSYLSWMNELYSRTDIIDLPSLEKVLIDNIQNANAAGCKIALYNAFSDFVKPNPYIANEIVKRIKNRDNTIEVEDCDFLDIQIARTLGIEYKKLGWTWLLCGNNLDPDVLEYLENNNALPKTKTYIEYEIGQSEDYLDLQIRGYAKNHPIGDMICVVNCADNTLCYARNDYFRRVLCNIIGQWVENGEYTSDEKLLKKLVEDIMYNNLKEAIS